jgi:uncharacterized protein (TIGR03435 family)
MLLAHLLIAALLPAPQAAEAGGVIISIQRSAGGAKQVLARPDVFFARGATLADAIAYAFDIEPRQMVAPAWFREVAYDFEAGARGGSGAGVRNAFRMALASKFSLTWRWESRDLDVWVLSAQSGALKPAQAGGGFQSVNPKMGIACQACSLATIAELLGQALETAVVDETGLRGVYNITAQWNGREPAEIARALREQAGLNLDRQRRQSEVLVIEGAVRPEDTLPEAPPPPGDACEAAPEIRAAINALPRMDDFSLTFEQRMEPRRALARKFPQDVFVQMAVQDAFRLKPELAGEWDAALASYAALDHPALGTFLEARLLVRLQRELSRKLLARVIEQAPDLPWAHLALAEWAGLADRQDPELRAAELRKFRRQCPGSLAALPYFGADTDPSLAVAAASALWPVLVARTDPEAIASWPHYWDVLAQVLPEDQFRSRVNVDVSSLRWLNRMDDPGWVRAVRYGYQVAGNEAALASFNAQAAPAPKPPPEPSPLDSARDAASISRALEQIEKQQSYRRQSDVPAERAAAEKAIAAAYARARALVGQAPILRPGSQPDPKAN